MPKGKRLIPLLERGSGSLLFRYANIEYRLRQKSKATIKWVGCAKLNQPKTETPVKLTVILPGTSFATTIEQEPSFVEFSDPCA